MYLLTPKDLLFKLFYITGVPTSFVAFSEPKNNYPILCDSYIYVLDFYYYYDYMYSFSLLNLSLAFLCVCVSVCVLFCLKPYQIVTR